MVVIQACDIGLCFSTVTLHYHIPDAFGAAASTRISNELGAGKPQAARVAFLVVLVLSVAECITASAVIFGARTVMGYAFSYEKEVVDYVDQISPLLSMCVLMDVFETVLSGIAGGNGWQQTAAYVNLEACYLVGAILLLIITSFTNWDKQAREAQKGIFEDKIPCLS
ncbi:hypothetical protein CDL12_13192 [Handroanthus impetiginosus]|uniref:Uncharacterized protein n=1 Tax=Handroanthus impetiginosus TaxID=429701 RepID=A0A2G9H9J2_9LAMI|nr:hypothetical protein CDL12_13192 [Handroanthus impetiginosus]